MYWLPIQSLTVTPRKGYQASIIYRVTSSTREEPKFSLSLRCFPGSKEPCPIGIVPGPFEGIGNVWKKLTIDFNVTDNNAAQIKVCLGLMVNYSQPIDASLILGQLNVSAPFPPSYTDYNVFIPWVDHLPTAQPNSPFSGTLTWEVSAKFPEMALVDMEQPENPGSAWNTQPTVNWFPSFLYFNIYAQPFVDGPNMDKVDQMVWIGTSKAGWSGRKQAFTVLQENLPLPMPVSKIRFYVQGVTDCGDVMKLEKCNFIDVSALISDFCMQI